MKRKLRRPRAESETNLRLLIAALVLSQGKTSVFLTTDELESLNGAGLAIDCDEAGATIRVCPPATSRIVRVPKNARLN